MVPGDVTLAFWGFITLTIVAMGRSIQSVISKAFDLLNARIDNLIRQANEQHTALKASVDCLSATEIQALIDYRLAEHGLIKTPLPAPMEGATHDDDQKAGAATNGG